MVVENKSKTNNYSGKELEFIVFCIENIAERLDVEPFIVLDAITKQSNIVSDYIVPCYDTLHTYDKDYIVDELIDVMHERGVSI